MVIEHCGSYDLDTPIEILVRLYLTLFAEKPFSFALFTKLKEAATRLGYMGMPNEGLMTENLYKILMKKDTPVG